MGIGLVDLFEADLGAGSQNRATQQPDHGESTAAVELLSNLDDLYQAGHIGIEEIANSWGQSIALWTAALAPLVERERVVHGNPHIYEMDRLVGDLQRLEAKLGMSPRNLDPSAVGEWLDFVIEAITDQLRLELEWKSGVIPTLPAEAARDSHRS